MSLHLDRVLISFVLGRVLPVRLLYPPCYVLYPGISSVSLLPTLPLLAQ